MANTETQQPQKQPQPPSEGPVIEAVYFVNSAPFDSEATSAAIGRNIDAAVEGPNGVTILRVTRDPKSGKKFSRPYLIPWANIRGVEYSAREMPAPKPEKVAA